MRSQHFVYLYRTVAGVPVYVGYGREVSRSISHRGHSHNEELKSWLEKNPFDLQIAGPYRDEEEAKNVESALISGLNPRFNRSPGEGPAFAPLGVPPHLSERIQQPALSLSQIGKATGGALLVYLAPGLFLPDGRKKFDAAQPTDDDAVENIERSWDIEALLERWNRCPSTAPKVLVGIHGKPKHRFIAAALEIDRTELGHDRFAIESPRWPRRRWQIPLADRTSLDTAELRGRRVENIRFGQFSHQLHIWVDRTGKQKHPMAG